MKSILSVLMAFLLCLASLGCGSGTTSTFVLALEAVSDAASAAVVLTSSLAAAGKIDPALAAEVSVYTTGIAKAVDTSIAELNSADRNSEKIVVISTAFANVAVPVLGSTAPGISATIAAVSIAVQMLRSQLNSEGLVAWAATAPAAKITLTAGDKAILKAVRKKTAGTLAKAAALQLVK